MVQEQNRFNEFKLQTYFNNNLGTVTQRWSFKEVKFRNRVNLAIWQNNKHDKLL